MCADWVDKQMPQGDEVFLDHVGFFTNDLTTAGAQLERLGFQVSAVNVQYNADSTGELVPSGTSNRLAKLRRGFIEVLAATSDTPLAAQLAQGVARYEGLHVIALTHPDMEAQQARLLDSGFSMQPLVNLRRRIPTSAGERQMSYSILRNGPGSMPEGRVQMLTTHTPELFWTDGVAVHENRADGMTDLLICVDDPIDVAKRYGRFTNRPTNRIGAFEVISLDRGRLLFATDGVAASLLSQFSAPSIPYIVGQGILSADLEATGRVLTDAGVKPVYSDEDLICVGPEDALGAYLLFHNQAEESPWLRLQKKAV